MKSIFNTDQKNEILSRLDKLQPDTKPLWGKMNASQMLAHCIVPSKVSLGEIQLKRNLFGVLFGKMAKKKMIGDAPFSKNLPTDPNFVIKATPDFYEKREELKVIIQRMYDMDHVKLAARKHPFFGKMTAEEWGNLSYKHFDHHLRQFDV